MNLAGLQLDIVWENKPANFDKVANLVANANLPKGTLLVLPEMFATGFSMDAKGITQSANRETEQFLQSLAREYGIYLLGGVVTTGEDGRERNQAVVFTPAGEECARYSKIFPFTLGGELENYAAGDSLTLWDWNGTKVSSFICYDLRFPEIFRHATMQGTQVITVVASWPHTRIHHWTTLLQARAIENQAYVIGVNRCGEDPKFCYTGESLIVHPSGKILSEAGNGEGIFQSEISLAELLEFRERLPFLRDIRPKWLGKDE